MAEFIKRRYLLMTADPVHVGTGGYRLGRVDNSIVREPGSNVPKIPGTSLHGVIRAYAARLYDEPEAAGQTHDGVKNIMHDPICYTFGFIQTGGGEAEEDAAPGDEAVGYSGVVSIFDAQVLLFPVHSMAGPVWVSTEQRLTAAGFTVAVPDKWTDAGKAVFTFDRTDALNVGWLMLNAAGKATVTAPDEWQDSDQWQAIADRIVLVKETLFSQVVNSNLEVRTSVSIDPFKGAAKDGALFTFEALPRAVFLTMDVVLDDYRSDGDRKAAFAKCGTGKTAIGGKLPGETKWQGPLDVVDAGLKLTAWLGVGGMGTRGFGRLAAIGKAQTVAFAGEVVL